ncbi:hypothetical protein BGX29_004687 [Mortierella sp. GBA35]|nr:hypothetical protein BGX29_004687 [Mortierella sp. GBA35]
MAHQSSPPPKEDNQQSYDSDPLSIEHSPSATLPDTSKTSKNGDSIEANDDHNSEWDFKLATLFSIFESTSDKVLHKALEASNGDLDQAIPWILSHNTSIHDTDNTTFTSTTTFSSSSSPSFSTPARKKQKLIQPRLSAFLPTTTSSSSLSVFKPGVDPAPDHKRNNNDSPSKDPSPSLPSLNDRLRWKDPSSFSSSLDDPSTSTSTTSSSTPSVRLKPLILYNPEDVAKHCPCTLIFNVLDKDLASRLLTVMLEDSETWNRNRWWLFERMVESPHKTSYFAERNDDMEEVAGWTYNGKKQDPPRRFLPEMEEAKLVVRRVVNELRKQRTIHPYEVQGDWDCNVAAVNHYAHSKESVGFHADKIRKVVPDARHPDTAGQTISIALPHNSLCIMWPPMQEEWKHEVPPQPTVTPHPISGTARINITYRLRREGFSPQDTPVCKCGVAMVLRCVFKNKANYGRYFYMCYAAGSKMGQTCGEFLWVDMEEKLGIPPPLSHPNSNIDGADPRALDPESKTEQQSQQEQPQQEQRLQESPVIVDKADSGAGLEGGVEHRRSSSPDNTIDHNLHCNGTDLDLNDELQDDDATLLEQQWEAIDESELLE